jgi:hypothetical protein
LGPTCCGTPGGCRYTCMQLPLLGQPLSTRLAGEFATCTFQPWCLSRLFDREHRLAQHVFETCVGNPDGGFFWAASGEQLTQSECFQGTRWRGVKESVELPPSSSLDDALFVFWSPEPPFCHDRGGPSDIEWGSQWLGIFGHGTHSLSLSVSFGSKSFSCAARRVGQRGLKPWEGRSVRLRHKI